LTRYELIKSLSLEEMALKIIEKTPIDSYCRDTCGDKECCHEAELECTIKWLQEEVQNGEM